MRGTRFELCLATTAIVLVAVGSSLPIESAPLTESEISEAVPIPEPANLPPPTAVDIARPVLPESSTVPAPAAAVPEIATPAVAAPAASVPTETPALTIDQRVAEKLRDMLGGRTDRF